MVYHLLHSAFVYVSVGVFDAFLVYLSPYFLDDPSVFIWKPTNFFVQLTFCYMEFFLKE